MIGHIQRGLAAGLTGRVAIVTGAGTSAGPHVGVGVGRAIAITLARAGAATVVLDCDESAAAETVAALHAEQLTGLAVTADVRSRAECERAVSSAVDHLGGVDILVNNAAIVALGGAAGLDPDEWDRVIATNLTGAMLMTRAALGPMMERGKGAIVNVSSIAAARGHGLAAYAASKSGLEALSVDTAFSYGLAGIRSNTIAVGSIDAPMSRRGGVNHDADRLRHAGNLLDLPGTGWDVAQAALFLAGDAARWITGVTLPVDGGALTTLPTTMFERVRWAADAPQAD